MAAVKKKDKVPLNLMDRQLLRMLREFRRVSKALISVGRSNTLDDVLAEAVFVAQVKNLLIVAIEGAETFPSVGQMHKYLAEHKAIDDEAIDAMMQRQVAEAAKTMFSPFMMMMEHKCKDCDQHLCGGCGKCHDCEARKKAPLN
jgi:uncharacterized protein YneF (UPF0154 family)